MEIRVRIARERREEWRVQAVVDGDWRGFEGSGGITPPWTVVSGGLWWWSGGVWKCELERVGFLVRI